VLRLLLKGCTNREIAEALSISDKTVKHYMTVLIQKLQVRNRLEVVLAVKELAGNGAIPGVARPN
jgi:DNA-binding NarL/FixJ family response regulator